MYRQYFRQAWCLMKQNRFFSAIYIIGTGLAISMVMVMAVVYHIRTTDIPPETHRDRMYYMERVSYTYHGDNGRRNSCFGAQLLREVVLPMQTPEAIAITTSEFVDFVVGDSFVSIPGADVSPKVDLMGCNDGFWHVYDFAFIEGKPFTEADFTSGILRAVITETIARKLYGQTDIVGRALLLNEVEYTVSGVVGDVSRLTPDVYADIWIPYTTQLALMDNSADEASLVTGSLKVNFLLHSPADTAALRLELQPALRRYNTMLTGGQLELEAGQLYGERSLNRLFFSDTQKTLLILGILLTLFLLVPALNLSGLNASHMQDRIPELGVRKAFGATRSTLFYQIFVENMLLMLPGGLAGLLLSFVLIFVLKGMLLSNSLIQGMTGGASQPTITADLLLNLEVFGYAFVICLVLNLLSSMIPVWRAVRVNITEALNN